MTTDMTTDQCNVNGVVCKKFINILTKYEFYEKETYKNIDFLNKVINIDKTNITSDVQKTITNLLVNRTIAMRNKIKKIKKNNEFFENYLELLSKYSRVIRKRFYIKKKTISREKQSKKNKQQSRKTQSIILSKKLPNIVLKPIPQFLLSIGYPQYKCREDLLDFIYSYNYDNECNLNELF